MADKLSHRLAAIVDALPLRPDSRVIEIGCGPGAAARAVAARLTTGHVLAIDRSAAAVAQARAGAADLIASGRLSVRQTRVEDLALDVGEEPYDLVFAVRVGALDGRDPEAGEVALRRIALATTENARLFVDGGDPLREVTIPRPTSHERMTGLPWDASYRDGPAPWDIGRPQPAIVRLASEGGLAGPVLDVGCGTGENALHVASLGLSVLGVDVAGTALAIAREKAGDREIAVDFAVADALELGCLGRTFNTVLDCGLFHTFDGDERPGYVSSLASVTARDGTLCVLCFSDQGPDTGPHPITQDELTAAFAPGTGWNVTAIQPARIQTRFHDDGAPGWFATIKRV